MGCGCCKSVCENGALELKMTMPMRESLHEYFLREGSIDMKMDRCSMEPPAPDYQWKPLQLDPATLARSVVQAVGSAKGELTEKGLPRYAREHPGVVGAAVFGAAAAAHILAHRR